CSTLEELERKIGDRSSSGQPLFVYTQPQNLHRMVLTNRGEAVGPGSHFPGFYEHYAAAVQRMDGCFGEFIHFLNSQRLYDDSIIILTSDHGDSLMEEGRWGHSYWLFPEILRIPLIIHLPQRLQRATTCAPNDVALSTDITPSLYYLLGHRPIAVNPLFGRS